MKLTKRNKTIIYIVLGIIALKGLVLFDVYGTRLSDPVSLQFKQFYPVKLIGWHMVSAYDRQVAYNAAKNIDPTVTEDQVMQQLIRAEQYRNFAEGLRVKLPRDAASDELTHISKSDLAAYKQMLDTSFGGHEADIRKFVAYPRAWEALVRQYYNSQLMNSKEQFDLAQSVLDRIKNGEKFEDLAMQYSEDRASGQLGGDLGFVEHGQLLPELEKQMAISPQGSVTENIIVSRYGYHVLYPVESTNIDGKKLWHVKHIFFESRGFEAWFDAQATHIKVINLF